MRRILPKIGEISTLADPLVVEALMKGKQNGYAYERLAIIQPGAEYFFIHPPKVARGSQPWAE